MSIELYYYCEINTFHYLPISIQFFFYFHSRFALFFIMFSIR